MVSGRRAKQERRAGMVPRAKRHHVVPQAYLKAWADEMNRVRVYDGRTGKSFVSDTKNAAVRSKLYTMQHPDGTEDDSLEAPFAEIEGELIGVIRDLSAGQWPLTGEGRGLIANFIALQIARSPSIPDAMAQTLSQVTEVVEKMQAGMDRLKAELSPDEYAKQTAAWAGVRGLSSGPSYTLDEFAEMARYPTLGAIDAMADLVEPIANLRFTLLESAGEEFLTSDQPIAHWPGPGHPAWMGTGLLTAEKSTLPISPTLCLQFQVPRHVTEELDGHRLLSNIEVVEVNQRTFRSASRHVVMKCGRQYLGFNFPE